MLEEKEGAAEMDTGFQESSRMLGQCPRVVQSRSTGEKWAATLPKLDSQKAIFVCVCMCVCVCVQGQCRDEGHWALFRTSCSTHHHSGCHYERQSCWTEKRELWTGVWNTVFDAFSWA